MTRSQILLFTGLMNTGPKQFGVSWRLILDLLVRSGRERITQPGPGLLICNLKSR